MHSTKSNGLAAANNQPAETYTPNANSANYPTGDRLCKQQTTLIALLVIVGHFVHRGRCSDYTICQFGQSRYCREPIVFHAFALRVGVCNV